MSSPLQTIPLQIEKELEKIGLRRNLQFFSHPVTADLYPSHGNAHQAGDLLAGQVHPEISAKL